MFCNIMQKHATLVKVFLRPYERSVFLHYLPAYE